MLAQLIGLGGAPVPRSRSISIPLTAPAAMLTFVHSVKIARRNGVDFQSIAA
jgi:hypothetical protein